MRASSEEEKKAPAKYAGARINAMLAETSGQLLMTPFHD